MEKVVSYCNLVHFALLTKSSTMVMYSILSATDTVLK